MLFEESQDPVPLLGAEEERLLRGQEKATSSWLLKRGDGERPLNESHDYSICSSVFACAAENCRSQYAQSLQTKLNVVTWLDID